MPNDFSGKGCSVEVEDQATADEFVGCRICEKSFRERSDLIEHLRTEHEILELASYAATTMANEQERDRSSREFRRRFELLKRELAGHDSKR
jgi:hypothetical protein